MRFRLLALIVPALLAVSLATGCNGNTDPVANCGISKPDIPGSSMYDVSYMLFQSAPHGYHYYCRLFDPGQGIGRPGFWTWQVDDHDPTMGGNGDYDVSAYHFSQTWWDITPQNTQGTARMCAAGLVFRGIGDDCYAPY